MGSERRRGALLGVVAGTAATGLLVWAGRVLDPFVFGLFVYAFIGCGLALDAWLNQRDYERDPRRPLLNELRGLVGGRGIVTRACDPLGEVRVDGDRWQALSASGAPVPVGAQVIVRCADSLVLEVEP